MWEKEKELAWQKLGRQVKILIAEKKHLKIKNTYRESEIHKRNLEDKLGLSCAKLTPQLSPHLSKLSTRTRLGLAIA